MFAGNLLPIAALTTWLTPLWLLAVGAAIGLAFLFLLYGLLHVVRRDAALQIPALLREGVLQPVFYLLIFLTAIAFVAAVQMPYQRMFTSAKRIFHVGPIQQTITLPTGALKQEVPLKFRSEELTRFAAKADQDVLIYSSPSENAKIDIQVSEAEPFVWTKGDRDEVPIAGDIFSVYVSNEGDSDATLELDLVTDVAYPQVYSVPVTAACVVILFVTYCGIGLVAPRLSAIANTTAKQAVAHPVFIISMALGAFLLLTFIYIPYNTFGEDVKVLKDTGMTVIMVLSILVALWTASISVAEEIEGRTALTLLSKPIGRPQFVLGKFLGIIWPIALMFIFLGVIFLVTVSFKVVYDARETSKTAPEWQQCYEEMILIIPGLALALMEAIVLASISVAISTRLAMVANLTICGAVYVMGHLVPMIVESSLADKFPIVGFFGMFIGVVFPVLDHFNIYAAVAGGADVPSVYLLWALGYCVIYCTIMMLLALLLFEDRDLA